LKGKTIIDIGSPTVRFAGILSEDYKAKKVILVDPFFDYFSNENIRYGGDTSFSRWKKWLSVKRIDGLGFLLKQKDNSANIMANNIDITLIRSPEYLKRLGEEICRVVAKGGVFITNNSYNLEEVAKKKLKVAKNNGSFYVFEK
jgi:septum formation topological specificity factor MinE